MSDWVCINGVLTPPDEARVSVFDSGFMQGIGLFETMRAYDSRIFRLDRHLARLARSAQQLGWSVMPERDEMFENIAQLLSAAPLGDLRVRLTVTTGAVRVTEAETPELTYVATATPGGKYPDEQYQRGVTVLVPGFRQGRGDPTIGHKTTSYFARMAALRAVHVHGAFEALWLSDEGHIAEGCISNVFIVHDGTLRTPPLAAPVLPGITRATVLALAEAANIDAEESPITPDDLLAADEAFLTNSMMELMPIVRVGRQAIGNEKPGDITRQLAIAYGQLIDRERADD